MEHQNEKLDEKRLSVSSACFDPLTELNVAPSFAGVLGATVASAQNNGLENQSKVGF